MKPTKEIDWDTRFKSICNFCRNYDLSPVLSTGSPESVIINKRLETLSKFLHADLDSTRFDYSYSKGSGKVPKAPWIAINLRGKRVSNSISFVICFARTGEGLVLGLMSPTSHNTSTKTIQRSKIENSLVIDYKDRNKYEDRFINPLEIKYDLISTKSIQSHMHDSCAMLLQEFADKYI